tara:strand:+ start:15373 stop:16116 length:744 start_codon:yes stop_codon:yes gene_type:complete
MTIDSNNLSTIVLAIELSNPSASADAHAAAVFCADDDDSAGPVSLIGSRPIPDGIRSSDAIMVLIESLCAAHQIKPTQIARIIVSIGPGGYTALRIASTTAKVLAHTLGCELVAVPSAAVGAQAIEPSHRPALIALASKNQMAHCSLVHEDGRVESLGVLDAQGIGELSLRAIFADKHLPGSFVGLANDRGISIEPLVLDARHCVSAAAGIAPIDPDELRPIYAREPDAVTQWRARGQTKTSPKPQS